MLGISSGFLTYLGNMSGLVLENVVEIELRTRNSVSVCCAALSV